MALTGYEYFKVREASEAEQELARPYAREIDFAYFAVRLGWSVSDYEASTPVQRAFIRKEIERQTVQQSELMQSAVQVAVSNVLNKKKIALWIKPRAEKPDIPKAETDALAEIHRKRKPWTPWQRKGGADG